MDVSPVASVAQDADDRLVIDRCFELGMNGFLVLENASRQICAVA